MKQLFKNFKPKIKNISNSGNEELNQLFKPSPQSIKPVTEEKTASKFSGLRRYLKRSI